MNHSISQRESNANRSIARLTVSFLTIGMLTLFVHPRITPPGGLVAFDYMLMCTLPLGAYWAGVYWHNGVVFLVYGAIGIATFIPGFLADGRLGLKYAYGHSSPNRDIIIWTISVVAMAMVCNVVGKVVNDSARTDATGDESDS